MRSGFFFLTALLIVFLDQSTKWVVRSSISLGEQIRILPFFSISHIINTGSAFGTLKDYTLALIWLSVIILGFIFFYHDRMKKNEVVWFSVITGGIVGNLIDRIALGAVTDFIDFSFWPAFNIADSGIVVGVLVLSLIILRE